MDIKRFYLSTDPFFDGKNVLFTGFDDNHLKSYVQRSGGQIVANITKTNLLIYDPDHIDTRSRALISYAKTHSIQCLDRFDYQSCADRSYTDLIKNNPEDQIEIKPDISHPRSLHDLYALKGNFRRQRVNIAERRQMDESNVVYPLPLVPSVPSVPSVQSAQSAVDTVPPPKNSKQTEAEAVTLPSVPVQLPPSSTSDTELDQILRDLEEMQKEEIIIPHKESISDLFFSTYYRDDTVADDTDVGGPFNCDVDVFDDYEYQGFDSSSGGFDSSSDDMFDIISSSDSSSDSDDPITPEERKYNRNMCDYLENNTNYFFSGIGLEKRDFRRYNWHIKKALCDCPEIMFYIKQYLPTEDEARFTQVFEKHVNTILRLFDPNYNKNFYDFLSKKEFANFINDPDVKKPVIIRLMNRHALKYHDPLYLYNLYNEVVNNRESDVSRKNAIKTLNAIINDNKMRIQEEKDKFMKTFVEIIDYYYYENSFETSIEDSIVESMGCMNSILLLIINFVEKLNELHVIGIYEIINNMTDSHIPLEAMIQYQMGRKRKIPLTIV